jgi:endoglucanase
MQVNFIMKLLYLWTLVALLLWTSVGVYPSRAQTPNYLHAQGNQIVDSFGNQVILTGLNWFGMETENYAPHGLWARSLDSILDQIVELGFNTIRLPYSNQLFDPSSQPNGINYDLNPDLEGLSGLEILDKVIAGAGQRGLKVILDRHRPNSHAQSELWYTAEYDEARWIVDWVMLAERYAATDTVIGMDLHNEPHGPATWGSDDPATDWRLAAERAGNAILKVNPNLLIIVEGVEQYNGVWYWWGGNLLGVRDHPVRLDKPAQLVYSTHVYGPGVYPQAWFSDPSFPDNLPEIWDRQWGYLVKEGIAPVIVGEFGGRSVGEDKEGIWQRALVSYLRENNLSYVYWTLNPNSGDTGGILLDDWQSVDPAKEALLSGYQFPLIGIEQGGAAPTTRQTPQGTLPPVATPAPTATPTPKAPLELARIVGSLRAKYRTANTAAPTQDSKPEFILVNAGTSDIPLDRVELRYWLNAEDDKPYVFHCDWAKIGCANLAGEFLTSESGEPYLSLHFRSSAGTIPANQDSGEIKLRFNRPDWSQYDQQGHYSFSPSTGFADYERVTIYVDGNLVWGIEPGSSPASPTPTTAAQAPPAATGEPQSTPGPLELAESSSEQDGQLPAAGQAEAADENGLKAQPSLGLVLALGLGVFVLSIARLVSKVRRD